jgi:hypothetical protein
MIVSSLLATLCAASASIALPAQQPDPASVIWHIDAAVHDRFDHLAGYTVIEHYSVFRGDDQTHPSAEMTVKTLYQRDIGKTYTILSQSGSAIMQKMAFDKLLDNEKIINAPANRESSWLVSANYDMKLQPGTQRLDGRDCYVLSISPRYKAPNHIEGNLWVDVNDFSIVQIQGVASKSPSMFAGPTKMTRQYTKVAGYAEATHASAETNAFLFGKITVTIDYSDYQVQLRPSP